jgi:hypothetical protein
LFFSRYTRSSFGSFYTEIAQEVAGKKGANGANGARSPIASGEGPAGALTS